MEFTEEGEETNNKRKAKSPEDWKDHKMNISEAIMKEDEGHNLKDIANAEIRVIQGIGPVAEEILEHLKLKTVKDLATYKYYLLARAIQTLAATESERPAGSVMNIDHALNKEYETKSLTELLDAPLSALEGLTEMANECLSGLHVKTINDLANFKFCKWAEAILELSKYEELHTRQERKLEKEMKKLC